MSAAGTPEFGRIPPHSEEAERGVLGCAILDAARVIDLGVERGLRPASFYFPAHRSIWETASEMHQAATAVDPLTLTNRLRDKQVLEEIGGVEYLQRLAESTVITAHAEYYMDIVQQKFILRTVIEHAQEAVDKCYNPDLDPNVVLAETEAAFLNLDSGRQSGFQSWDGVVAEQVNEINRLFDCRQDITGVPTGFTEIDRKLRGMQRADMIVLAARPSMGKTSLALNIAENVAMGVGDPNHQQRAVAIFSLEMSGASLARRMICCRARVPMSAIGGRGVGNETHGKILQSAQELKSAPIFVDDTAALDVMDMRSRARRLKKKHDIQFIVIDYLQIAHCAKYGKESWQREVGGISGETKAMAKELDVPVLILSQLSRAAETRDRLGIPKLSDLRDSGSIEQDADVVWLLRRPARYPDDPRSDDQHLSIVDIAKHRNGECGDVELNFFGEFTRFENRTQEVVHPI